MDQNNGGLEDDVFSIIRWFSDSVLTVSFQGTEKKTWGTQRRSWLVLQPRHLAYPPQHFRRLLGRHLRYPVEPHHFFTCTSRFYHVICFWHSWDSRNWKCWSLFFITFWVILSDCCMVLCDGKSYWMIFDEWFLNEYMYVWCKGVWTILPAFWLIFE